MTNLVLNVLVLAVLLAVCVPTLRRLRTRPVLCAGLLVLALTLVFDPLMIAVGLYAYAPDKILGLTLGGAPVEDFAYPVAAALAMPVLWTVLGRRGARGAGRVMAGPGAAEAPLVVDVDPPEGPR